MFLRAITVTERAIARSVDCECPISDATSDSLRSSSVRAIALILANSQERQLLIGCEQPLGLDVNQSPDAQDTFRPMPLTPINDLHKMVPCIVYPVHIFPANYAKICLHNSVP